MGKIRVFEWFFRVESAVMSIDVQPGSERPSTDQTNKNMSGNLRIRPRTTDRRRSSGEIWSYLESGTTNFKWRFEDKKD